MEAMSFHSTKEPQCSPHVRILSGIHRGHSTYNDVGHSTGDEEKNHFEFRGVNPQGTLSTKENPWQEDVSWDLHTTFHKQFFLHSSLEHPFNDSVHPYHRRSKKDDRFS